MAEQTKYDDGWARWYGGQMEAAEARFRPLKEALDRRLEVSCEVVQTGGMVMCLSVPVGSGGERHALFSELCEFDFVGLGLYVGWDDEGVYRESGMLSQPGTWADNPELCEQAADWAAPIIVAFVVESAL